MGDLAQAFRFQPSELWAMDVEELLFWHGQAVRLNQQTGSGGRGGG